MPTLFTLFGLRFMFYSNDHEPIHVHVVKGGAEETRRRGDRNTGILEWNTGQGAFFRQWRTANFAMVLSFFDGGTKFFRQRCEV